ncbi:MULTISPECIES: hypothetical protein [Thermobifida]|jgi:hypothetical protein|nr:MULTISPECIES: hypothetical protein [Thermobifida]MDD6792671.1 hypothetical protein [Thermobifida fusca]
MNDRASHPTGAPRFRLSEDWAATVLGLVLLAASLIGIIPTGLVP